MGHARAPSQNERHKLATDRQKFVLDVANRGVDTY